jgi:hypothetical protein
MTTQPTIDQSEIELLKARVNSLESSKRAQAIAHAKAEHCLMEEIKRLERLLTEEHETLEDICSHTGTLCDALERHTDGEYRVEIGAAREAIAP